MTAQLKFKRKVVMPSKTMPYRIVRGKEKQCDGDFQLGEALAKASQIQRALKVAQKAALFAKDNGDWYGFGYHIHYCGRLSQGLHDLKNRFDLDVFIPDPVSPDLPGFISQETRENFPEV